VERRVDLLTCAPSTPRCAGVFTGSCCYRCGLRRAIRSCSIRSKKWPLS
jgi:hypothetical protein